MSINAGTILTLGGNNVIDRLQSAGLGDVNVPVDTIREVGNSLVVDKVDQDPDFSFSMESLDVSTDMMAWLTGAVGAYASASAPGSGDPNGTEYKWEEVTRFLNIVSPWKDPASFSSGNVVAGHIVPGYYPTQISYRFGVTDNATQQVELSGGSFFYGKFAPIEQYEVGDGTDVTFATDDAAIQYRKGGAGGSTFTAVFGVLVDGVLQTEDIDYTVTGGDDAPGSVATITFTLAPANGADIRFCYFTSAAQAFPASRHVSSVVKPGAVRGRNICVKVGSAGIRLGGVQSAELTATIDGEVEREFCNTDPTGRTVNGTDCNGSLTVRAKDAAAFFTLLKNVTGVRTDDEVVGWLNNNPISLDIEIQKPSDPGTILKTLYVADAKFQVPGTPARVNAATDFVIAWTSVNGTFSEFKGARP